MWRDDAGWREDPCGCACAAAARADVCVGSAPTEVPEGIGGRLPGGGILAVLLLARAAALLLLLLLLAPPMSRVRADATIAA